jgi:hypothetical protein
VQQIAQGRTQLECLVTGEHVETRTIIKKEIITAQERTGEHISSEIHKLSLATTTASQRQKFLESLKSQDLNQRYNDIMEPEDATFERIFISYDSSAFDNDSALSERASCDSDDSMREIDQAWEKFIRWLQTSEPVFWIRGKPGSGKSTLMKFIVNSTNTKDLLANWNSEVIILSHFFWKIGSQPQNSIKGLLCSLCHQILKGNHDLINYVLNSQPHMSSNAFYHDWSLQEVKTLLFMVLDYGKQHFCIFIDGLDEVSDKEGPRNIMDVVTQFIQHQRVKVCVSSRPETGLIQRLERLKSPGLKLELLTGHEMRRYVQEKLGPLREDETISASAFTKLIDELTSKAAGVFLWLYLATKSIMDGASQGDNEEELLSRLQQIPGELEDLYAEMWKRLNHNMPIYQQTAAGLFQYALNPRSFSFLVERYENLALDAIFISTPLVFQIACARSFALQEAILLKLENIDDMDFLKVCEKVENDIRIRCAGLLEIQPGTGLWKESWLQRGPSSNETFQWVTRLTARVNFIHRTAHDYLLDTEAGQNILKHNPIPSTGQNLAILRGTICMAYVLARRVRLWINVEGILRALITEISSDSKKQMYQSTSDILSALNDAYNHGCIRDNWPLWWPRRLFLSQLALFTVFDDFVISSLKETSSITTAEEVLRNIWEKQFRGFVRPSTRLVEELIALGANWHSYGICLWRLPLVSLVQQGTAFTRLLVQSLSWRSEMFPKGSEATSLLQLVLGMAYTCPSLDRSTLVWSHVSRLRIAYGSAWLWHSLDQNLNASFEFTTPPAFFFHEVKLRFILRQLVIRLVAQVDVPPSRLSQVQEITTRHEEEPYKLRLASSQERSGEVMCYKALAQEPFTALNAAVFDYGLRDADLERQRREKIYNEYFKLCADSSIMEPVPYKDSLYALAKEGLDICTPEDAGIVCPESFAIR